MLYYEYHQPRLKQYLHSLTHTILMSFFIWISFLFSDLDKRGPNFDFWREILFKAIQIFRIEISDHVN